jgi:hypothetical protein
MSNPIFGAINPNMRASYLADYQLCSKVASILLIAPVFSGAQYGDKPPNNN